MSWARIRRVTFARSTTSGEGLHTNVTACPASFSEPTGTLWCWGTPPFPNPAYDHEPDDADRRRPRPRAIRFAPASARATRLPGRHGDRFRVRHGGRGDRHGHVLLGERVDPDDPRAPALRHRVYRSAGHRRQ